MSKPLTFDGGLHPLELQEYPDGVLIRHDRDLRNKRSVSAAVPSARRLRPPAPRTPAARLTSNITHFTTLPYFSHSSLVLVHLATAHHVLRNRAAKELVGTGGERGRSESSYIGGGMAAFEALGGRTSSS
ncbi:hypothetical protein EYF80_053727 [Liparis tanakae]|uniref:Uncharacterized protein n=1 Tax=Liparis tanakae TaxID=230148 RepID=A0A4Z2F4P9_9TELE|nr:hypothetical protein EYF80_053727 [Liparis tanakae]